MLQSGNGNEGRLNKLTLALHGTKNIPDHVARSGGKRQYNYQYNNVQNVRDVSLIISFSYLL